VTNPAIRPVAGRLPYFGVVVHRGRSTGRVYRTPVTAFPYRDGFVVALTYGRDVDWLKNVIAEGGCRLVHRGRTIHLTGPRVLSLRQEDQAIPGWIRGILRLLTVDQILRLDLGRLPSGSGGVERPGRCT
jgi:deazaflavin-dependent oxidoreductase (nitroreductase family)